MINRTRNGNGLEGLERRVRWPHSEYSESVISKEAITIKQIEGILGSCQYIKVIEDDEVKGAGIVRREYTYFCKKHKRKCVGHSGGTYPDKIKIRECKDNMPNI